MRKFIKNIGIKAEMKKRNMCDKITNKMTESDGVSLSKENLIWIIIVLVVGGLAIGFVQKFFPEIFELVGQKIKEFFGQIKITP